MMEPSALCQQYAAFTSTGGFVGVTEWGCLEVTGKEGAKVLQGLCTNDILGLPEHHGREAFFTDHKGHVLAHTLVLRGTESLLLVTSRSCVERLLAHCERYIIREDASLRNLSDELDCLLVNSRRLVEQITDTSGISFQHTPALFSYRSFEWEAIPVRSAPLTTISSELSLVMTARTHSEAIERALSRRSLLRCDAAVWNSLRIETGFPDSHFDLDERTLPQEVGRDQAAISFNKGCYLGQETVARIDALGHVNRQLVVLQGSAAEALVAGAAVMLQGKAVGTVTSVGYSCRLSSPIALAFVRREQSQPGTELDGGIQVIAATAPGATRQS
jgi:tRNA-modifying protein YgfZ